MRKLSDIGKSIVGHQLCNTLMTFVLTVFVGSWFTNKLASDTKMKDEDLARKQRAVDSVKVVTDLIYERSFRANMVVSAIKRRAPIEEIRERKRDYDAVFVKYNSSIQSNIFRIRDMFQTNDYAFFQTHLTTRLRTLLFAQDECLTKAYDLEVVPEKPNRDDAAKSLSPCVTSVDTKQVEISELYDQIVNCEFAFSDSLFKAVEKGDEEGNSSKDLEDVVNNACKSPSPKLVQTATSKAPLK